jgi:predicted metalloprotease
VEEVIDSTITDVDAFWAETVPALWGIEYRGPIVNGPYFPSRGDVPACRGPMDSDAAGAGYCRIDDTVQWDQESMTPLYQHFGGFAAALALAHEWGHAIQERLGFDDVSNPSIVYELQADCFAGAWAGSVDAGHSEIPRPDPGDLEAGMSGYFIGGSPDHGSSFDRLNAFFDGFGEGAGRCASYTDSPPEIMAIPSLPTGDGAGGSDLSYEETAPRFVEALEVFWTTTYPEVFGQEWVPVSNTTPYDPSGDNLPACDGYVGRAGFYEGNAYFCAADDFVAWDEVGLFPDLYAEIGDFAIGFVLADEWGKAVRVRAGLGGHEPETQFQADCLAGVFAAALVSPDNPMGLVLSAGDLDEGISGLLAMSATPDVERHARSPQRLEDLQGGVLRGYRGVSRRPVVRCPLPKRS